MILTNKSEHISVADILLKRKRCEKISNNKVYLISRGCVYEHLQADFNFDTIDKEFIKRNKDLKAHLHERQMRMSTESNSHSTAPFKAKLTKNRHYSKKFAAGKIVGLQNILPGVAEVSNVVYFSDNLIASELVEIDIEPLK